MTTTARANMFGVHEKALLTCLKGHERVNIIPSGYHERVIFVRTPYAVYRTFTSDTLLARYPLADASELAYTIQQTREQWASLEACAVRARLHMTTEKRELDSGKHARLLVTEDGEQSVWVEQVYLDVFETSASLLAHFLFESIRYHERSLATAPARVSVSAGNAVAYIMPSTIQKKVW